MAIVVDALADAKVRLFFTNALCHTFIQILVLLDSHRLDLQSIAPLWYNSQYSEARHLAAWNVVLDTMNGKWNIIGVDLKNEPHGEASWGKNVQVKVVLDRAHLSVFVTIKDNDESTQVSTIHHS